MQLAKRLEEPDSGAGAISGYSLINFIHAHGLELLTAVCLLYIVGGTLVPFDFSLDTLATSGFSLSEWAQTPVGVPDLMTNIAVYVPLGALLHICLVRWGWRSSPAVCLVVLLAAALSAGMEALQVLSACRVSSMVKRLEPAT